MPSLNTQSDFSFLTSPTLVPIQTHTHTHGHMCITLHHNTCYYLQNPIGNALVHVRTDLALVFPPECHSESRGAVGLFTAAPRPRESTLSRYSVKACSVKMPRGKGSSRGLARAGEKASHWSSEDAPDHNHLPWLGTRIRLAGPGSPHQKGSGLPVRIPSSAFNQW